MTYSGSEVGHIQGKGYDLSSEWGMTYSESGVGHIYGAG